LARRFASGFLGGGDDGVVERREAIPGDRRLERVGDDPHLDQSGLVVRHADESVAPGAGRPGTMAFAALRDIVLGAAAEIPANLESTIEPRPDRMIVVLEREHDDRLLSVAEAVGDRKSTRLNSSHVK